MGISARPCDIRIRLDVVTYHSCLCTYHPRMRVSSSDSSLPHNGNLHPSLRIHLPHPHSQNTCFPGWDMCYHLCGPLLLSEPQEQLRRPQRHQEPLVFVSLYRIAREFCGSNSVASDVDAAGRQKRRQMMTKSEGVETGAIESG